MVIGVLAVQGDYQKHLEVLKQLNIDSAGVKTRQDLKRVDGLIIPGGESTTIMKMLNFADMVDELKNFAEHKPVFGTCAGSIILAKNLSNPDLVTIGAMDITISRNAYGTQVDSFIDIVEFQGKKLEAVFIRAPKILETGDGVEVLIHHQQLPVLVRQKNLLACTFHPELSEDDTIHKYFLSMFEK